LTTKDFHHKNTAPDLPIDWTAKEGVQDIPVPGEQPTASGSDRDIVNARELFAKFMSDVENNKIQF